MGRGKVITVTLPEETWRKLKRKAFLEGKSISAFVRERIEKELGRKSSVYEKAHKELEDLSRKIGGHLEGWSREELYEL